MFSFVEDAIGDVIKQILGQSGMLGDLVMAPIRAIVQQVLGGIWKGNGADKFVNDMTQNILPKLNNLSQGNQNYGNSLQKASDTMIQSFQQANNVAQGLFDVFNSIF
jgi:hypothetical protein